LKGQINQNLCITISDETLILVTDCKQPR
jgi:hypothetical protein